MTFIVDKASSSTHSRRWRFPRLLLFTSGLMLEFVNRQRLKAAVGKLSARELRDIGLTENDVSSVGHSSLQSSASELLDKVRRSRAGNW